MSDLPPSFPDSPDHAEGRPESLGENPFAAEFAEDGIVLAELVDGPPRLWPTTPDLRYSRPELRK